MTTPTPEELTAEQKRAIRLLLDGEYCYSRGPRRITRRVADSLSALGLRVQSEHGLHEPRIYYPLDRVKFLRRAKELGLARETL